MSNNTLCDSDKRAIAGRMHQVIRQLSRSGPLSAEETVALHNLDSRRKEHKQHTVLTSEGEISDVSRLLLSGWACHDKLLPDGRRQILEFFVPGDILLGSCTRYPGLPARANTVALTQVVTVDLPALETSAVTVFKRLLARAIGAANRESERRLHNHLLRLGRMNALERMAHLFVELRERLTAVGLADGDRFPFPLRQEILADALGLSVVHVNRTLQHLRRLKLIDYSAREVLVIRLNRFEALAQCNSSLAFTNSEAGSGLDMDKAEIGRI